MFLEMLKSLFTGLGVDHLVIGGGGGGGGGGLPKNNMFLDLQ